MIDVEKTIISQYANSPTLIRLIENMNEYLDPRANFDDFFNLIWNVDTAVGFGLDIWGRIVNISRILQVPGNEEYFGFNEASPGSYPFDERPFWDGSNTTQTYVLADDAYRQLILIKAIYNITSTNAPSLNQLLQNMFATRGRVYVNDLGGMQFRYTFEFALTPVELAIVIQSGVFPRPSGVNGIILQTELPVFGFYEMGAGVTPYDEAPFISEDAIHAII